MRPPPFCFTCRGSNGSIMPVAAMRRIQLSLFMLMECSERREAAGGRQKAANSNSDSSLLPHQASRILDHDLWHSDRLVLGLQRQLRGGLAGDLAITRGDVGVGHRRDGGIAAVGLFADADVQWQRTQQRHMV